jgi:hypothetical protein
MSLSALTRRTTARSSRRCRAFSSRSSVRRCMGRLARGISSTQTIADCWRRSTHLSAQTASARPDGRSSVASHVEHLRYSLELLNHHRSRPEPWAQADWADAWTHQHVNDDQWLALRSALATEAKAWLHAMSPLAVVGTSPRLRIAVLEHSASRLSHSAQSVSSRRRAGGRPSELGSGDAPRSKASPCVPRVSAQTPTVQLVVSVRSSTDRRCYFRVGRCEYKTSSRYADGSPRA